MLELVKWEQVPDVVIFLVSITVFLTSRKDIYIFLITRTYMILFNKNNFSYILFNPLIQQIC